MEIVITDKNTGELIAAFKGLIDFKDSIVRKDIDIRVFENTKPTFQNIDGIVKLTSEVFIIAMGKGNE